MDRQTGTFRRKRAEESHIYQCRFRHLARSESIGEIPTKRLTRANRFDG